MPEITGSDDSEVLAETRRECDYLRSENARLHALLAEHGIVASPLASAFAVAAPSKAEVAVATHPVDTAASVSLNPSEKIALFRRLFRGRTDVYPVRWESKAGKSGYAPACGNEWRAGVCDKPRIKCADCGNRLLLPVTDHVIYQHLAGKLTVGVYPLLGDESCHFLAVDFDEADWRDDAKAFMQSCRELGVPAALEISRSGQGAHVWIFFSSSVPARDARCLGAALISHTCARTRQLKLNSYDRLFPNQDTMPKGGFGNLIALPLQKTPREKGFSVFVDDDLLPYPDQWAFLKSIQPLSPNLLESTIQQASGGAHPLDVAFVMEEDEKEPWNRAKPLQKKIQGNLPEQLTITLANQLFFAKDELPQPLANRLIRLAAFQNPEFYSKQAMRMPVWNIPRVIGCAENYAQHIALPRGCLDAIMELLKENHIGHSFQEKRFFGNPIDAAFTGTLRPDQVTAVDSMTVHDIGILCAPTAFGKTVAAAAIIAKRNVNTLILVHRSDLVKQWQERLEAFLDLKSCEIGTIGAGKSKPKGQIDIATMQSLSRKGEVNPLIENYGHIVIDECHHLSAISFEAIMKSAKARYVPGLTATPIRRDGKHPILFMQCGPIRFQAGRKESLPIIQEVHPRFLDTRIDLPVTAGIQDVFKQLIQDSHRNAMIVADVIAAYAEGRKIIVLTGRTEHLQRLELELTGKIDHLFVLQGRLSKMRRAEVLQNMEALGDSEPRVLLANASLVGEGFDHPPLNTLVLAMPVSWGGSVKQYAGRIHRHHTLKTDVRIYDYIELEHKQLARMWEKRRRAYAAMGYHIVPGHPAAMPKSDDDYPVPSMSAAGQGRVRNSQRTLSKLGKPANLSDASRRGTES